jgi:hypothetical protein
MARQIRAGNGLALVGQQERQEWGGRFTNVPKHPLYPFSWYGTDLLQSEQLVGSKYFNGRYHKHRNVNCSCLAVAALAPGADARRRGRV